MNMVDVDAWEGLYSLIRSLVCWICEFSQALEAFMLRYPLFVCSFVLHRVQTARSMLAGLYVHFPS